MTLSQKLAYNVGCRNYFILMSNLPSVKMIESVIDVTRDVSFSNLNSFPENSPDKVLFKVSSLVIVILKLGFVFDKKYRIAVLPDAENL